jgi:hypothetical protein
VLTVVDRFVFCFIHIYSCLFIIKYSFQQL